MFSSVSSFGLTGIACYPVTVEADVSRAFPCFEPLTKTLSFFESRAYFSTSFNAVK